MNFFTAAKDAVGDRIDTIRTGVSAVSDKLPDLPDLPDSLVELKDKIIRQAEEFKNEKLKMLKEFEEEKKRWIRNAIMAKLEKIIDHAGNVIGEHVKEEFKDPYMPGFVQRLVDDLVDSIWPDVKIEVKDVILTGIIDEMPIEHGSPPGCCCGIFAWIRHALLPYNKSGWRKVFECSLKNWFFWFFTICALVPRYGVGQITYILWFFVIDHSDEYQLQLYIINFKALQFVNLGVLSAIIGAVQYYVCISATPNTCQSYAPQEELWTLLCFVLQVCTVWICFCMLGSAKKKGGFHYQLDQASQAAIQRNSSGSGSIRILEELAVAEVSQTTLFLQEMQFKSEEELLVRSRGRLVKFLVWDMFVFAVCLGLVAFTAFSNFLDTSADISTSNYDSVTNWKFEMTLYWIKALYGLLSFPFVVLKLPVFSAFISHARATGYNPYGRTVPFLGREEHFPTPWCPEPPVKEKTKAWV